MRTLFRPVGLAEMGLILDANLTGFPPRLPEQPIFYPVLNKPYADQIARDWNTKDKFSGYVGFVTEFRVSSPFIDNYEEQLVGSSMHHELWIPAEDLEEMNANIVGKIKLVDAFYGDEYKGPAPDGARFEGENPIEQFVIWNKRYNHHDMDFYLELKKHWKCIYMNYPYWSRTDFEDRGISAEAKSKTLQFFQTYWQIHFPEIQLF
ncbi:hypothetical protein [Paenibacillus glycinis]|uniref:hypothetical protein n=1 Tax=Paenibacillus glycinis TaxID=2697035 RepID=UPI00191C3009|nr:hypothetical protein [Paenibacillus glycinis]